MRDPSRRVRVLGLLAVLASYLTVALYSTHYGFEALTWDDSEYVAHALDTVDHVDEVGLASWLTYIPAGQHYGKPPLYVNSLALVIHFVGRSRTPLAIGLLASLISALLGLAVFRIVRPAMPYWFAILAMLAVSGIPVVAQWAPSAFPDMQLALCVLGVIVLLLSGTGFVPLGIALGLGMLSKITFPFYVVLPIAYWWRQDRKRLPIIGKAAALGSVIALSWWAFNFIDALRYGRVAYGSSIQESPRFADSMLSWVRMTTLDGLGLMLLGVTVAALVFFLPLLKKRRTAFPAQLLIYLALGALPVLVIAMPVAWRGNRHLLPALVLSAMALFIILVWIARNSRIGGVLTVLIVVVVTAQWALSIGGDVPAFSFPIQNSRSHAGVEWLQPAIFHLQPTSSEAVRAVIDQVKALGIAGPAHWYLSGNDGYVNIPRLQLAAKYERLPVEFDWADYFSWPEGYVHSRLNQIAASSAMLMLLKPVVQDETGEYINRRRELIQNHLSDFVEVSAGDYISIYATKPAYAAMQAPLDSVYANFDSKIELLGAKLETRSLTLRFKAISRLPCKTMLMIHAIDAEGTMHPWDQPIDPPACKGQNGDTRLVQFKLPEAYLQQPFRLQIGFFDEDDKAHEYPPFQVVGGGNSFCIPSADGRAPCPVGIISRP